MLWRIGAPPQLLALRSHGCTKDLSDSSIEHLRKSVPFDIENGAFNFIYSGFNLRSTDLQAYIGLRQIDKADKVFEARNKNHMLYLNNMSNKFSFQKIKQIYQFMRKNLKKVGFIKSFTLQEMLNQVSVGVYY